MSITTTEPMYAVTATPRSTPVTRTAAGEHATATSAQVESPSAANPPRSALHEVAARYDVRHMTAIELDQMSQELYEARAIDPFQHRNLDLMASFPYKVERGADGQIRSLTPTGLTGPQTPRDYLEVQEEHIAFLEQHGLDSEVAKNVLDLLRTLDALKTGGVDVSA
jgi:hypothetical protein